MPASSFHAKRVHLSQEFGLGVGTLRQPDDRKRERRRRRLKACQKVTDACQRAEVRGASLLLVCGSKVVQQAVGPRLRRTAFLARVSLCLRQNEVECRN